jgi:hypothetical protein
LEGPLLSGPTAAPLVDGFVVQAHQRADLGVRERGMVGEGEGETGATDFPLRGGVLGEDLTGLLQLLGGELGLVVRFG